MDGAGLYLPLALLALAVALLFALRDDAPEVPDRAEREDEFDFGPRGWMAAIPREFIAPSYLTVPENEKPSDLGRPAS